MPAGGILYLVIAMLLNMNGSLDLLVWLVFVGLGVAFAVESVTAQPRYRLGLILLVGVAVLLAPVWHFPAAPLKTLSKRTTLT